MTEIPSSRRPRRALLPLLLLALAAACGDADSVRLFGDEEQARRQQPAAPSAPETAQLLSLLGAPALAAELSPYDQAVTCFGALRVTAGLVSQIQTGAAEKEAFRQAEALFRSRALRAGQAQGETAVKVGQDLERASRGGDVTPAENLQRAVACLNDLQA